MATSIETRLKKLESQQSTFDTIDDVLRKMNTGEPLNIGKDTHLGRVLQTIHDSAHVHSLPPNKG